MTFDEVPPGQVPTRMTPAASSGGSENACASPHASSGMMPNCATVPMKTSRGRCRTSLKSSKRRVMPMPNMTMPSRMVIQGTVHLNVHG